MSTISFQIIILTIFAFIKVGEGNKTKYDVTVEVLTILDKNLSEETDSIFSRKFRYCDLFQEVQKIFDIIEEIKIKINLSGLKIMTKVEEQLFREERNTTMNNETYMLHHVSDTTLKKLKGLVQKQSWKKDYDVILLLTSKLMGDRIGFVGGLSFRKGSCNDAIKFGISIPKADIIAHELGHLLGAEEDDNFKRARDPCYEEGINYIMSHTAIYKRQFSKCSILSFQRFLKSPLTHCLRINNVKDSVGCNRNEYCPDFCIPSTSAFSRQKEET